MSTYRIAGKVLSGKEVEETLKKASPISDLKPGDLVLVNCPDSWSLLREENGEIGQVTEITPCRCCAPNPLYNICPGKIGIYHTKTKRDSPPMCWGFGGGISLAFGLIPQKKRMLIYRKEG